MGEAMKIELHHVLNQKDGGAGIVENAVMLCGECHLHIHDNNFKKSVLVFRSEFKYANWDKNPEYKGRKKGKDVEFTKKTLDDLDKQYKGKKMIEKDNIGNHIRMLEDFRGNLLILKPKIIEIRNDYQKQIGMMEKAGFFEDIIIPLRKKYQIFALKVNDIDKEIMSHQKEINRAISILNKTRSRARMN